MKPLRDIYYIRANKDQNKVLPFNGIDNKPLFLDVDFNALQHAVQNVEIVICPASISPLQTKNVNNEQYEVGFHNHIQLVPGDKIYVHHFCVSKENLDITTGEELYIINFRDIYAVIRDGKIIPLEDWTFCSPVFEAEEHYQKKIGDTILYTKSCPDLVDREVVVKYMSPVVEGSGVEIGDKCFIHQDSEYELVVEGEKLYRIKFKHLLAVLS